MILIKKAMFNKDISVKDLDKIAELCSVGGIIFEDYSYLIELSRILRRDRNFILLSKLYDAVLSERSIYDLGIDLVVEYSYFKEMIKDYEAVVKLLDFVIVFKAHNVSERIAERYADSVKQTAHKISFDMALGLSEILYRDNKLQYKFLSSLDPSSFPDFVDFLYLCEKESSIARFFILFRLAISNFSDDLNLFLKLLSKSNFESVELEAIYSFVRYLREPLKYEAIPFKWNGDCLVVESSSSCVHLLISGKYFISSQTLLSGHDDSAVKKFDLSFLSFDDFTDIKLFADGVCCDVSRKSYVVKSCKSLESEGAISTLKVESAIPCYIFENVVVSKSGAIILNDKYIIAESCHGGWNNDILGIRFSKDRKKAILVESPTDNLEVISKVVNCLNVNKLNYYHFLIDYLLKVVLLPELAEEMILTDDVKCIWHDELYNLVGLKPNFYSTENAYFIANKLYFPVATTESVSLMSRRLKESLSLYENRTVEGVGELVYIDRRNAKNRKILNEDELIDNLKSIGFSIVRPESFSVLDQVIIFNRAKIIVSPSGAALTNMLYCNESTKVIEIFPEGGDPKFWPDFSKNLNVELGRVIMRCEVKSSSNLNSFFKVDIPNLISVLNGVLK